MYRAGKARWVVVSAGNQPGESAAQVEADAILEMLNTLGVPNSAIQMDDTSRNTIENARKSRKLLDGLGARRVLLVTSAQHMPRAMKTFSSVWAGSGIELIAAATDVGIVLGGSYSIWQWLPQVGALAGTTQSLKEYAGMLALDMMHL